MLMCFIVNNPAAKPGDSEPIIDTPLPAWGISTNQEIPVILRLIKILNKICCIAAYLQISWICFVTLRLKMKY